MRTDSAALAAARALAARHGIRIVGFETSGIGAETVADIAAAIDDLLGRYPFVPLHGIEIAELGDEVISQVRGDDPDDDVGTAAWILLDRPTVADHARLSEKFGTATRSGQLADGLEDRPMYSIIVGDVGKILTAMAPRARGLAQRALVTEYHRISGPWDRGVTLAVAVTGYRKWRDELSSNCYTAGRWDPCAGLSTGFIETQMRGTAACGPAKVLSRLLVEMARGQAEARAGAAG
ncbi:hypothetical protein [Nocardia callitridis]|uniref:Uncharacterized protein n=1 Tax=Nocardia callitridis TaxID=648753 RepID=A0ABP9KVS1_9NOCA